MIIDKFMSVMHFTHQNGTVAFISHYNYLTMIANILCCWYVLDELRACLKGKNVPAKGFFLYRGLLSSILHVIGVENSSFRGVVSACKES